jgi:hypothetical protein
VPSAIKHDHELSSRGLVSILVEAQGSNEPQLESFLWKTFPDNDCFTCTNSPVPIPESRGIPHGAVIGVDGTLLWAGNPTGDTKKIGELIEAELQKVKKGWGDSAEAKKMRASLYGKNDLAGAAAAIAAMPEGEARTKLQAEIDARYAWMKKAIGTQKERGNWLAAQDQAKALLKGVGTNATWVAEVQPMVAEFDTDAGKAELALEKKLEKVIKQLRDKKGDNAPKLLKALAKDAGETKVGARIARMLTALETPPR